MINVADIVDCKRVTVATITQLPELVLVSPFTLSGANEEYFRFSVNPDSGRLELRLQADNGWALYRAVQWLGGAEPGFVFRLLDGRAT